MEKFNRHIFLTDSKTAYPYTSKSTPVNERQIARNRRAHGEKLQKEFEDAWDQARKRREERMAAAVPCHDGVYIEFEISPNVNFDPKSLESLGKGIRLSNCFTRSEGKKEFATIYLPSSEKRFFLNKVKKYLEEETSKGSPKNKKLITRIESLRLAFIDSFWQDQDKLKPKKNKVWCEVWLYEDDKGQVDDFRKLASSLQIECNRKTLHFPERAVVLVKVDGQELEGLVESSGSIAEFRRAKETPHFFMELKNKDQVQWAQNLLDRLKFENNTNTTVCILDTGVNRGHPLLEQLIKSEDVQAVEPDWGVEDDTGHGTNMAGLAAFGDLTHALESLESISIVHRLESVKILPPKGSNSPELYGEITRQAISKAEIQAPKQKRVLCMAITASDGRDKGRPSSWSSAVDSICVGSGDGYPRLVIISSGNIPNSDEWKNYPNNNFEKMVQDPGQAWNALVVGAYTQKIRLTDPSLKDYKVIAEDGGLSPFSTTSYPWDRKKWPVKPDLVAEGGNAAVAPDGFVTKADDLSLLTTHHKPTRRLFTSVNATSAASALVAKMAATVQAFYPKAWPETVRGLLIHAASWTSCMKRQLNVDGKKKSYADLLACFGYGVPNLEKALKTASNSLTLIMQEEIQPFTKTKRGYKTKDMHLHEIPWPKEVLEALGELEVTMRVTLSYFIEPGPGEIGYKHRYRYASHGLRFSLIKSNEEPEVFLKRINKAALEKDETVDTRSDSDRWLIGPRTRHRGSLHSDIWQGTAADIATCNVIGVYPVIGWWRERHHLGKYNQKARYSLIVSIHTPEEAVDLYTPVVNKLKVPIGVDGKS